ncbi:hypothetical protein FH972_021835 [Carpinus fangiana]|uniref:HECT-type E3 ubiquitin transferase n=1 Tax=Carpinus fangiana TaxID=176857 RepID=A0A5N6KR14_9ROSI|nr:hypothetical protein FH972_021835 [Carpinus fangiana]
MEYRCPTCLMINDLKPQSSQRLRPNLPLGATNTRTAHPPSNVARADGVYTFHPVPFANTKLCKVLPITLERTQALIDQCTISFLQARLAIRQATRNVPSKGLPRDEHAQNFSRPIALFGPGNTTLSPKSEESRQLSRTTLSRDVLQLPIENEGILGSEHGEHQPNPAQSCSTNEKSPSRTRSVVRKPLPTPADESLPAKPTRRPPIPPMHPQRPPYAFPTSGDHQASVLSADPPAFDESLNLSPQSRSRPIQTNDSSHSNKSLFRTLEDYLVSSFGTYQCLNQSFLKHNRRPRTVTRSANHIDRARTHSPAKLPPSSKSPLSDIDPKMLLIGDIAENGLWWTGKHDRTAVEGRKQTKDEHPDRVTSIVSHRSPYISWIDVNKWYNMVTDVGRDWRILLKRHNEEEHIDITCIPTDEEASVIDAAMAEARSHVQRVLLRTTDALLKRPGGPLKEASDLRFLLILLANPVLFPSTDGISQSQSLKVPLGALQGGVDPRPGRTPAHHSSTDVREQSHAYAILKRILGLLSNTSPECQRDLTSWFSRYDEVHFRSLVELIESFVTHRLRRQSSRKRSRSQNITGGLIPHLSGSSENASAELHAALGLGSKGKAPKDSSDEPPAYSDDWQTRAAARVMALLFAANKNFHGERTQSTLAADAAFSRPGSMSRYHIKNHGQLLSTSDFYNTMVDYCNVVEDFDTWEGSPSKFTFCQYPFFLSVGSKIRIMEHDARRQMEIKAREALFKSLLRNAAVQQYMLLKVRRECLVEDSLKGISEVVAQGQEEIKKGLKVQFANEEGVDAGGLRKEWFLLLVREIFDPLHAMFLYDEDSHLCYFNAHSFETSDQYFLVGALLGLAIYNSTILDVALPPFTFKKLLLSGGAVNTKQSTLAKGRLHYSLEDLAEWRPRLAKGLRDLLEFEGDVQETFCRDFVIEVARYGETEQVELCAGGAQRAVTKENRQEFVDLYVRYLLETQVTRQFEPFKRGFFTVCGGNALSLFQPEEIDLVVRGSEEALDVPSLKAVAVYENWQALAPGCKEPSEEIATVRWFWEAFGAASAGLQRKLLGFVTGSDRIPAVGATKLVIRVAYGGADSRRLPVARTCFNQLLLHAYGSRQELEGKLWTASALIIQHFASPTATGQRCAIHTCRLPPLTISSSDGPYSAPRPDSLIEHAHRTDATRATRIAQLLIDDIAEDHTAPSRHPPRDFGMQPDQHLPPIDPGDMNSMSTSEMSASLLPPSASPVASTDSSLSAGLREHLLAAQAGLAGHRIDAAHGSHPGSPHDHLRHLDSSSPQAHHIGPPGTIDPAISGSGYGMAHVDHASMLDDELGPDGKRGSKRELSTSKRAAQNRAAQSTASIPPTQRRLHQEARGGEPPHEGGHGRFLLGPAG